MKKGVALRAQITIASTPAATVDPAQVGPGIAIQVLSDGFGSVAPYTVTFQKPVTLVATPAAPAGSVSAAAHSAIVNAQLYIEGDARPADDFIKIGQNVVARLLAAGLKSYTGPYTLTLGTITPLEGSDDDDDDEGDSDAN